MQITKKIFRISSIFPCLLCLVVSFAQKIDKFSCNFEVPNSCQWTQDSSDDFSWTRHQGLTKTSDTGPLTDHTKSVDPVNKKQGPGFIRHSGGKCIHYLLGSYNKKPKEGESLVTYQGCGHDWQEFRLWPNGTLMLTNKYSMCVKPTGPVTDGVKVGIFSSCDATDTWSWTAQGSLQYKKKMCLQPRGAQGIYIKLVLDSICDQPQNVFEFVPTSGWYLYIEASQRKPNNKARLISPSTTKAKSCLHFFYHMYGAGVGELRVYVKSGGKMDSVWSLSGNQGDKWNPAQVAVNDQTASYQYVIEGVRGKDIKGDIAIDDISLMVSCLSGENQTTKPTTFTVSTTPASSPSLTSSEENQTTKPTLIDNNGSKKVTTIFTVSTTPTSSPSQTSSQENQPTKPTSINNNGSKKVTRTFPVSTRPASSPSQTTSEDKGTMDDSIRIIIIATTVGAGIFLGITLIVLLIKYKRLKRASKLSTPVNIPLEVNEISPQPLPVDEARHHFTIGQEFYQMQTRRLGTKRQSKMNIRRLGTKHQSKMNIRRLGTKHQSKMNIESFTMTSPQMQTRLKTYHLKKRLANIGSKNSV